MQIQIVMEEAEFVESIRQAQQEPYLVRHIERQIRQLTAEKAHTQGIKEKLYGDYADEILTREDFLNYNELYSKRIEEYDRKITELEAEQRNLQTAPNAYPFLDVYRKYRKLEEITRPMVVEVYNLTSRPFERIIRPNGRDEGSRYYVCRNFRWLSNDNSNSGSRLIEKTTNVKADATRDC